MDQEKQHDIALMRYSVISPVLSGLPENYSSLEAFYRDASNKGTIAPDGTLKHFAPATMERWCRNYRRGGFDALIPQGRVDEGRPRKLDDDLQEPNPLSERELSPYVCLSHFQTASGQWQHQKWGNIGIHH